MAKQHAAAGRSMGAPFDFTSLVLKAIVESSPNPAVMNMAFPAIEKEKLDGALLGMQSQDVTDMWTYIATHLPPGAKPAGSDAQAACKTAGDVLQAMQGAQS